MEKNVYTHDSITWLYSRNQHIVSQLHFNKIIFKNELFTQFKEKKKNSFLHSL